MGEARREPARPERREGRFAPWPRQACRLAKRWTLGWAVVILRAHEQNNPIDFTAWLYRQRGRLWGAGDHRG
ncbi:MAG: hypothetical protein VYB58_09110, partial [Verrucomicrobiota bacterium]|nr:hypothetical protein [Verrucomicrobiota bacterium]